MSDKKQHRKLGFAENFGLSGVAAIISKTAAAPIERVKLLVQNQDEMLKQGRITEPYKGVIDCTLRTYRTEGLYVVYTCSSYVGYSGSVVKRKRREGGVHSFWRKVGYKGAGELSRCEEFSCENGESGECVESDEVPRVYCKMWRG